MAIDPDDVAVATDAVQALLDQHVPSMFKHMITADTASSIATAVLQAVDDRKSGKTI